MTSTSTINKATYQAAGKIAGVVETHMTGHLMAAQQAGETDLATIPCARVIEKIIDIAFWASLRREEGNIIRISIAYVHPCQAGKPMMFEHKLPLSAKILTKLAPGVSRAGIHIGVWEENGELYIWGTTNKLPNYCFVLDVSEPGLLVVKHRRITGLGKFTNVATLRGDQVKMVDERCGLLPDSPRILSSLLGINASPLWNDPVNILIQIAVSMRAHQRGGILLVTPAGEEDWRESVIHPLQYPVFPAFTGVADLVRQQESNMSEIFLKNAVKREVDNLTGFTAVDGATVINDKHELLTFGAKISRARQSTHIEQMLFSEPVLDGSARLVHPSAIGGTRHLSAAQFVHDQNDSLALVASQDGYFTVFSWSAEGRMVQAHRIDILLL